MKRFLRQYFWDFALCFLIGTGISVNVFAGYEMNDPWSGNLPVVILTVFCGMAVLFASRFNPYGAVISALITAAALVGMAAALYASGAFSGGEPIDENPLLFWIITAAVSMVVFWTTRFRAGILLLFLAMSYMSAAFEFLLYPVSLRGYFAALLGMAILFQYRGRQSGAGAGSAQRVRTGQAVQTGQTVRAGQGVQMAVLALAAVLLASGAYYGIVKPLDPPEKDQNLIQRLMAMEIMREAGISTERVLIEEPPEEPEPPPEEPDQEQQDGGTEGDSGVVVGMMAITYKKFSSHLWLAAIPVLMLGLALMLKVLLRRRWYAGQLRKTQEEAAIALYLYFVRKLKKAGFKRPSDLTLLEYAAASREKLARFAVYDADFLRLTGIYLKMIYGYQRISEEEGELFHDFYKEFYKNLRAEMGTLRYCLRFFTI